jgi:hypothetical protein
VYKSAPDGIIDVASSFSINAMLANSRLSIAS